MKLDMKLDMKYFVLKPKAKHKEDMYAQASQQAMIAYANHIRKNTNDYEFATEVITWARMEHAIQQTIED